MNARGRAGKHPPGATAYAIALVMAISGFILAITIRTVVAAARGQLFPAPAPRP